MKRNGEHRKVVVVTGASAGVGRATVRELAREGALIGLLARGLEGLEDARREVEELGGRALVLPTDVSDPDQVEEAAEAVEREFGPIDIWINCAMVSVFAPVWQTTPDEYKRVIEVNYLGYVYGTQAALKRMKPRDEGVIIQVSSALAFRSIPLQSAYCASKGAILRYSESLRSELIHEGSRVHVGMVHLPAVNTPQFEQVRSRLPRAPQPVPPIYQPEVAARAIVHAAHARRRSMAVGLSALKAIIGNRFIPGLLDRYLARVAWDGQMTDAPADPDRPDNLWEPLGRDLGAHGDFDARSRGFSPQLWMNEHRGVLGVLGLAAAAAGAAWLWQRTREEPG